MSDNHVLVTKGFRLLLGALAPYLAREFQTEFGSNWWTVAVMDKLYEDQKRDLPTSGDWATLVDSLDIQRCLLLFDLYWNEVFRKKLSIDNRTWAKELVGVRNRWAHSGAEDIPDNDMWRALDTMSRLCENIDPESAEEIRSLLRESRYGSAAGSTTVREIASKVDSQSKKTVSVLTEPPVAGLPCWRDVMEPHPDVAQGRYKKAEFAADLSLVARGEGSMEYLDPVEFFARTYVTEGMSGLLGQALRRVTGKDGEPVIQLKTAFGGGKTHSMLALYHMLRGRVSIEKIPVIKPVLEAAGISSLPKVNVAVLVGTALDPTRSKRPVNFPGITINTLWGEMAAQLAESAGNPKLYDYVKEADRKGVSPGSETLKNLFDACGPCVVLMDELVNYAKKLYGAPDLPAGSFDNFISFIQEMTEAARASKNSMVVASIPESEIEIGGDAGKIALETIEHTFGRMESIWKPVAANEGFEVVRRRLFLDCKNPEAREQVCTSFSRMYVENAADFPHEVKELEYKSRLISCYPIHPEIFDRLYEDWATLERFQRTRGVLRLMASVIHELWMGSDAGLMIMPGSIPLDVPSVRDELTRHLDPSWNSIVEREVDGKNSIPYQKDQGISRYGRNLASRRVARTILLGSAPTVRDQAVRGIESSRIRLGVVQPGEIIANFNDALSTLQKSLAYLYSNSSDNRFWYDLRPTLHKTAEDRALQISDADADYELELRLKKLRREEPFAGIHSCPSSSLDIPDEQAVRIVILRPAEGYRSSKSEDSTAMRVIKDYLDNRGTSPRIYRNMLAFIAPDQEQMESLKHEVKRYLAWQSIKADRETLNLDVAQNRQADISLNRSDETVELRIKEAYCWLFVPYVNRHEGSNKIEWEVSSIKGGNENIVVKAAKQMRQTEAIITKWAPMHLLTQLNDLLWKDSESIEIKRLWDYLSTYCYLPRLANYEVLKDTIRTGLNSTEYFAIAAGIGEDRYVDLKYNQYVGDVDQSAYLVRLLVAKKQFESERAAVQATTYVDLHDDSSAQPVSFRTDTRYTAASGSTHLEPAIDDYPKNTHFYMSATLDNTRLNRDVQRLVEEVISHITSLKDAKVEISLEVEATAKDGVPPQIVRTISENCRTLKVENFGFSE